MNASWHVRPATPADVAGAMSVLEEAAAWLVQRGTPLWLADEIQPALLDAATQTGELFVAAPEPNGNQIDGMMLVQRRDELFWPEDSPGAASYVHRLAIRRSCAGRGLAAQMLEAASVVARLRGNQFVKLDCEPRTKLIRLYEDAGFGRVDAGTFGRFEAVRFCKRL